ncbi:MAG: dynamin family protein [Calditrichaceae bacterium]|nr:dynamin family protein [Calditrichia bacterium]NUQ42911.1 dynamin family protein [Calditrichaceae bacterium]
MNQRLFDSTFTEYKFKFDALLKRLHELAFDIQSKEAQEVAANLRSNLSEPFLFVVVGEVKSGKSSFINALLEEEICKVDPAPCTDAVQQIVYAEEPHQSNLSAHLRRIGLPKDILKTIAIVDTPGTNTVIEHHQEITQRFIPNSDLVIFVFPAKNPHTKTAWDMLDYVNEEWRRKVIFVLQQADLATAEELQVNLNSVRQYLIKRNIASAPIFVTSVQWEKNGDSRSGFTEIRDFIRSSVTGGKHYGMKLRSVLTSTEQVLEKIKASLAQREKQLEKDKEIMAKLKNRLSAGEEKSRYEIANLVQRLVSAYDRIAEDIKTEFEEGLSVLTIFKRSFSSLFHKERSIKSWINDLQQRFETRLNSSLEDLSQDGARHFVEGIRQLLHSLLEDMERSQVAAPPNADFYLRLGERRQEVLEDVKKKVSALIANDSFVKSVEQANPDAIAGAIIGGGSLAVIGALIMGLTKVAVLDITGGILTGMGFLFAGAFLLVKRSAVIKKFHAGIKEGKKQFEAELQEKLSSRLKIIYEDIDRSFGEFYNYVKNEEERLAPLIHKHKSIEEEAHGLAGAIQPLIVLVNYSTLPLP